jgi:hypothetical protein
LASRFSAAGISIIDAVTVAVLEAPLAAAAAAVVLEGPFSVVEEEAASARPLY